MSNGKSVVVFSWLLAQWVVFAGLVLAQDADPTAAIRVNLREEKAPVPATLYGIFMEEISHAFDGGIYAELIQNRSFEEGVLPPGMRLVKNNDGSSRMELEKLPAGVSENKWDMPWPWNGNCGWDSKRELIGWSLVNEGGARADMKVTDANPMNAASSRSLAMTVAVPKNTAGRTALVNSGYWGINVQTGTSTSLTSTPTGHPAGYARTSTTSTNTSASRGRSMWASMPIITATVTGARPWTTRST
ncbi:MAG: hypothetical protein ABSH20_01080 [Tepidisphaeraceae bacterium]|jgi:hypothetical protein